MTQRPRLIRWLLGGRVRTALTLLTVALLGYIGFRLYSLTRSNSPVVIGQWFTSRDLRPPLVTARDTPCPGAPFLLPSSGLIGLLYADPAGPYTVLRRHQGIDIFGDGAPGTVPIVAAYDGLLYRQPSWRSTVAIQHDDPLQPGRTIWTYYTHMANTAGTQDYILDSFPPGTQAVPVVMGQLIGYQGDYGGNIRVGLHLHFSIVVADTNGNLQNEAVLANTLDPSPYLGMDVSIYGLPQRPIDCDEGVLTS